MSCTSSGLRTFKLSKSITLTSAQSGRQSPAVGKAEEIGSLAGLTLDQMFERQSRSAAAVAAPMHQHEGRHAGVDDRGAMRATVAQAEQAGRIVEHLEDRRVIARHIVHDREIQI